MYLNFNEYFVLKRSERQVCCQSSQRVIPGWGLQLANPEPVNTGPKYETMMQRSR